VRAWALVSSGAWLLLTLSPLARAAQLARAVEGVGTPALPASEDDAAAPTATPGSPPPASLADVALPCYFLRVEPMPDVDLGIVAGVIPTPTPTLTSALARPQDWPSGTIAAPNRATWVARRS
jgi:hypothetical protein